MCRGWLSREGSGWRRKAAEECCLSDGEGQHTLVRLVASIEQN